jgi:hypothetical protein
MGKASFTFGYQNDEYSPTQVDFGKKIAQTPMFRVKWKQQS